MAKVRAVTDPDALLREGLRKAIDGQPHPLQGTPASGALFGNTQKAVAQQAIGAGHLETCEPPAGVKKTKKTPQYVRLSGTGRQLLLDHESPRAILEVLHPLIRSLAAQVGELGESLRRTLGLVEQVLQPPRGQLPPPVPAETVSLDAALREAYEKLRWNVEYRDGLVELPHLYHEVRKSLPRLAVADYHAKLLELWNSRRVELHILNEVRTASEPDKAILRNDRLYYYLLWKQP